METAIFYLLTFSSFFLPCYYISENLSTCKKKQLAVVLIKYRHLKMLHEQTGNKAKKIVCCCRVSRNVS